MKEEKYMDEKDIYLYITLLHKTYFELLKKIATLDIRQFHNQKEFAEVVLTLHSLKYDKFIEQVESVFEDNEEIQSLNRAEA